MGGGRSRLGSGRREVVALKETRKTAKLSYIMRKYHQENFGITRYLKKSDK